MTEPKISVIIPAYNEAAVIGDLVRRVSKVDDRFEIIVVDDGSKDETGSEAREAGATVVHHPYNVGNGASIRTGAIRASGDVLLFMDGDGQHPPEEIPKLLENIGEYDMVVGARNRSSDTPLIRKFGNWGLIKVAQMITGHKIEDLTSGFRAVKRDKFMEFYHLYPNRYSYPTTITISFFRCSYFIKYVHVPGIKRRETGASDISPLRDGLRFIYIMVRALMLFSPQHLFLPLGALFTLGGFCFLIYQIVATGGIRGGGIILFISGVFTFLFGLMAEQIAAIRRQRK
jgi:glycosyltransferase involved in cell wall biosynthesis